MGGPARGCHRLSAAVTEHFFGDSSGFLQVVFVLRGSWEGAAASAEVEGMGEAVSFLRSFADRMGKTALMRDAGRPVTLGPVLGGDALEL